MKMVTNPFNSGEKSMFKKNKKGFTLIELMVVIVIIGILAALAIPKFTNASAKAKWSEVPTVLASYDNAQLARLAETGTLGDVGVLVFEQPDDSKWFTYSQVNVGNFAGLVRAGSLGGIDASDGVQTTVDTDGGISHATYGGASSTAVSQMMGNFLD
jgi:prepilin-type N-terminal cleavage/methylation domain-containing protein